MHIRVLIKTVKFEFSARKLIFIWIISQKLLKQNFRQTKKVLLETTFIFLKMTQLLSVGDQKM